MLHIVSRTARKNPPTVHILPMMKATEFIRARIGGLRLAAEITSFLKMNCVASGSIATPFDTDDFMRGTLDYLNAKCGVRMVIFTRDGELLAIDQRAFIITENNLWDGLPHIDNLLSLYEQLCEDESKLAAAELQEAADALADARSDYEEVFARMFAPIEPGALHKLGSDWTLHHFVPDCKVGDVLLRRKQLYIRNI